MKRKILVSLSVFLIMIMTVQLLDNFDFVVGIIGSFVSFTIVLHIMKKYSEISNILLIAYLLRFIMVVYLTIHGEFDSDGYQVMAESFYNMDFLKYLVSFQTGAYLYSWIIAGLWKITGESLVLIRIINCMLSFYCCVLGYKLSFYLYNNKEAAKKIAFIIAIFPNLIRFSSYFSSRETIFVFTFLISIKMLYHYYDTNKSKYAFLFFVTVFVCTILHTSAISLLVGFLLILYKKAKTKSQIFKVIVLSMILTIGTIFMIRNGIGTEKLYLNNGGLDGEKLAWIQSASSEGRAAYLKGFGSNNIFITILQLPIRVLYFLYTPFIWMIRTPIDVLGFLDASLYLVFTYKLMKIRKKNDISNDYSKNKTLIRCIYISLIIMISMFSIGTSNYGTAIRHRAKMIIPILLLATPALRKKEIRI